MAGNIFGRNFRISTFGESHGPAIGVVIDGCPPSVDVNEEYINALLALRKPGQSKITTQRKEDDKVEILSGVFEGKSTGTPIALLIRNQDQRSKDYSHIKDSFRPSHADFTYEAKYGHRDYRGGGRSSARETAARVAAGAIAMEILKSKGISAKAYVSQVYDLKLEQNYKELDLDTRYDNIIRCPEPDMAKE